MRRAWISLRPAWRTVGSSSLWTSSKRPGSDRLGCESVGVTLPLLFLSGAGLPAWVWDDVRRRLPVESRVADHPRGRAGLADHAEAAREAAADWPAYGVVAHSIGGVVAAALVARDANRVHAITAVWGIVPRPGASFVASLPMPKCLTIGAIIRFVGTKPPDSTIRSGLCHGLPDAVAERVVADFTAESRGLYLDAAPARRWPRVVAYVATTEDTDFPLDLQRRYAVELGATPTTLPTGHLAMLQDPAGLAALIGPRPG
jgi:pimeloyl-ACP methyl ester carboxylesterase